MKKKTILHVITSLGSGGAQAMLYSLLKNIDKNKFDVVVVSMVNEKLWGDKISQLGIPVFYLGIEKKIKLKPLSMYANIIKKYQPDIIHAWMYDACFFATFLRKKKTIKKVIMGIHYHLDNLQYESLKFKVVNWFLAKISKRVLAVQYVSTKIKDAHIQNGYSSNNAFVIHNGFDLNEFKPIKKQYLAVRKQLQVPNTAKLVGMFARFHPMKNHRGFIEMASRLIEIYDQEVYFILGGNQCNSTNQTLQKWIQQFKLQDRFFLIDEVSVKEYMPALNVHVLSSSYGESFGMVLCEAMACGVPCVSTNVGDAENILGKYGYIVPVNNPEAMAFSIHKLLSLSQHELAQLSECCRDHIQDKYSIEEITQRYEKLYLAPCSIRS